MLAYLICDWWTEQTAQHDMEVDALVTFLSYHLGPNLRTVDTSKRSAEGVFAAVNSIVQNLLNHLTDTNKTTFTNGRRKEDDDVARRAPPSVK